VGRATTVRASAALCWGAIVSQVVFVAGFVVVGAMEGHGYSPVADNISDLSALTAHHAGLLLVTQGAAGALTIAFALGALGPALTARGPWLLALSLAGLDNVTDVFFRLSCRAADAGCTDWDAARTWTGKVHVMAGALTALATIAAPFVLARRMEVVDGWRRRAGPTRAVGYVILVLSGTYVVLHESGWEGLVQRLVVVVAAAGVVALALALGSDLAAVDRAGAV